MHTTGFEIFIDTPTTAYDYKSINIGDVRTKQIEGGSTSTFNNVIESLENINNDLGQDLRVARKNLNYLINLLVEINDLGKIELSTIAKDLSNKIVYIYDNLVTLINNQRSENLKLQLEIAKATKEKNDLRHEVELLTESIRLLEVSLGVQEDTAFESMLTIAKQNK